MDREGETASVLTPQGRREIPLSELLDLLDPERADEIDAALGDGSRFHETYGYYAHGVGPGTPVAPAGWQERLVHLELPAILPRGGSASSSCPRATAR